MAELLFVGAAALFFCFLIFVGIRYGVIRKNIPGIGYTPVIPGQVRTVIRLTGKDAVQHGWVLIGLGIGGLCMIAWAAYIAANAVCVRCIP